MTTVRAAITQTTWTGDKESMLDKHEQFARDAAAQGAQVDLLPGALLRPVLRHHQDKKYYDYAEPADGPIVQRFAALAKELGMVMVLPIYEEEQTGVYYNTAVVVDADGTILGKYRKHHIPHLDKFWEKFYFRPGNLGYPVFDTAVGKIGDVHLLRPALPRGLARARPERRAHRLQPERHQARPLEPPVGGRAGPRAAVANGYFVLQPNRVGLEDNEYGDLAVNFYGTSQVDRPAGQLRRRARLGDRRGAARARPRHGHGAADARRLAVLPRPPARLVHRDREAVSTSTRPEIEP